MKKTSFYSLMRKGGKTQAVLHNGYSDGTYYYFKDDNNWWYAIHPLVGLSVAAGRPRKLVAEQAHDKAEAISRAMDRQGEYMTKQFEKAIAELKKENKQ